MAPILDPPPNFGPGDDIHVGDAKGFIIATTAPTAALSNLAEAARQYSFCIVEDSCISNWDAGRLVRRLPEIHELLERPS